MKISFKNQSSLSKLLPGKEPAGIRYDKGCALRGEVFSYQVAYRADYHFEPTRVEVESPLAKQIRVRSVELVPVDILPEELDADIAGDRPGLYPDRLAELHPGGVCYPLKNNWHVLWVTVEIPRNCKAGEYAIRLKFTRESESAFSPAFHLEVLPAVMPEQTLKHTNWFHTDCLCNYYNIKPFTPAYWRTVEHFMRSAAAHGVNMILTPVFTPPLDTAVMAERPTVQLVKVGRARGKYTFDFTRLTRWINLARKCGIRYFEISHLFSQWGAECTPKIVAEVDGREKRIFGWDTRADSGEYETFLASFLPELTSYLKKRKLQEQTYFHCSDEPAEKHLASYGFASKLLRKYVKGFKIFDALSEPVFYQKKLVEIPIPVESNWDQFEQFDLPERWTYYCCGPLTGYSNRFIYMNSGRNRILGSLLYYHRIEGFLHWGFNFYYARLSRFPIDPYRSTTSGGAFPAGDGFVVYPGPDGVPEDSLRFEVFREGLQDMRALQLLERFIPAEKIRELLDKAAPSGKLSMGNYPCEEKAVLALREKVNALLRKHITA